MNKTCDNCKWLVQYNGMCCHTLSNWKLRPESNTCENWGANPLVQLGIDIERTRCAEICDKLSREYRNRAMLSLSRRTAEMSEAAGNAAESCALEIRGEGGEE